MVGNDELDRAMLLEASLQEKLEAKDAEITALRELVRHIRAWALETGCHCNDDGLCGGCILAAMIDKGLAEIGKERDDE